MQDNPYVAPQAQVADVVQRIPGEINGKIRAAVVAGMIAAGLQALFVAMAIWGSLQIGVDAWGLIDVAVLAGLTYGVHRRSRVCAVLLLLFFVAGRVLFMIETGKPSGLLVTAIFAYYLVRGVLGTIEYHRFVQDPALRAAHDAGLAPQIAAVEAARDAASRPETDPSAPRP